MNTERTVPTKGNGSKETQEELCIRCYRYAMLNDYYLCPECTTYYRFNKEKR